MYKICEVGGLAIMYNTRGISQNWLEVRGGNRKYPKILEIFNKTS
jgi:hypothetical protein